MDHEEALSAAAQDFRLATDFSEGRNGKPKDLEQAAIYLTKAAEAGHCLAAYSVCAAHLHGRGVPQNFEVARSWALRVKELGSEEWGEKALETIDKMQAQGATTESLRTEASHLATKAGANSSQSSLLLLPILFWGGLGLLFYLADVADQEAPGSGRSIVGWVFGLGALGIFLNIIWGRTMRETANNFAGFTKQAVIALLGIVLLGSIGFCSVGSSADRDDGLGNVPDQFRKP